MKPIQGLHHITAMAGDPQANLAFYHDVLGQRLVKRTVNFDDPGTWHFYFADETGTPGTLRPSRSWPVWRSATGQWMCRLLTAVPIMCRLMM